ncbi:MAG TPA: aldehyde dehydrogenase family protein [Acidimicrobiales bacterium]|nr:aldehyde dehydrogenase family protein [Acidimicrobiales bacterium]
MFPDADLDAALPVIVKSALQNAGQTCSAGSRLLLHEDIRDAVLDGVAQLLARVRIGAGPTDPDLGPLISAKQRNRVESMVTRAADAGSQVAGSGTRELTAQGFFFPPTLVSDVDPASEIAREEVFGPVVAAMTFATVEEAVALANGTDYGLIAAVWTKDVDIAFRLSEELMAGQVYLNTYGAGGGVEIPFGRFKKSGYRREKGFEALAAFCQTKSVILKVQR